MESVRTLDLNNVPMRKVTLEIEGVRENYSSGETVRFAWTCADPSGMVDHFEVMVDGSSARGWAATGIDRSRGPCRWRASDPPAGR